MRVIGGIAKGRRLKTEGLKTVRPTSDRARETLFNILSTAVEGEGFLDLFAGFGCVGIEAISRGAAPAVFVDKSPACCRIIRHNLAQLEFLKAGKVIQSHYLQALKQFSRRNMKFRVVFADPPYSLLKHKEKTTVSPNAITLLQNMEKYDIVFPDGLLVVEHFRHYQIPERCNMFTLARQVRVGDSVFSLYRRTNHTAGETSSFKSG